jgi:acetolactate synthase-1/3 small subunit
MTGSNGNAKKHLVSLYVANNPGVIPRVAQVFARRGFNIDSMVGSEGHDPAFSHINIVASGDEKSLEQILKQLARLVDVVHARDATGQDVIQRELALIKVRCPAAKRAEVLDIAHTFRCHVVDLTESTLTVQVTGKTEKVDALHRLLTTHGIIEMVRTGKVLMARGEEIT